MLGQQSPLKKTALYLEHETLKARLVPFAGYSMPVQYAGLMVEHQCVRNNVGLFDVSHMGIATCEGADAFEFLNQSVTRDLSTVTPGRAAYTLLCRESGNTVDDLIIYRESLNKFYLVLNASNKDKDFSYLNELKQKFPSVTLTPLFDSHSLLALQGPKAFELIKKLGFQGEIPAPFSFVTSELATKSVHVAFTGYTGEKGCEIFVKNEDAPHLWKALLSEGAPLGIQPIGLGARDTLRTEMGYSLYGHELSETINPVEAGLSWAVGFKKANFVGKSALEAAKAAPKRKLIALSNSAKQAPRAEMLVYSSDKKQVGVITSGTFAPSLGHVVGLALVEAQSSAPYFVDIRGTFVPFDLTTRPFLKKS